MSNPTPDTDPSRPAAAAPTERELSATQPHDPYLVWRFPSYRRYFIAWFFTALGQQFQGIAILWEVLKRTDSALSLGIASGVQALPVILLALPAGQIGDRFDGRKVVALCQAGAAITGLGLAAASYVNAATWWLYLLLGLNTVFIALHGPARATLVPRIIPRHAYASAAAWGSSGWQIASLLGSLLGGVIILWSIPLAYAIDGIAAAAFAIVVLTLDARQIDRPPSASAWEDVSAGVKFVFGNPIILGTITLDLFAVLLGGAVALLPIFARDILHVGETGLGALRAAPGAGALIVALILAHRAPMKRAGPSLLWAVAGFGVATIVFGISRSFVLSLAMLFMTGALDMISVVIRQTLVQTLTPDHMRGRVSAVHSVFIGASNELGGAESGLTAHWWGPVRATVVGGIGTITVVIAVALGWPHIRRIRSLVPDDIEQAAKPNTA